MSSQDYYNTTPKALITNILNTSNNFYITQHYDKLFKD